MSTKENFHILIDQIEDERALSSYYELFKKLRQQETGRLWKSLSASEQQELMVAYDESFDAENLIPHNEVKREHGKWLNG